MTGAVEYFFLGGEELLSKEERSLYIIEQII